MPSSGVWCIFSLRNCQKRSSSMPRSVPCLIASGNFSVEPLSRGPVVFVFVRDLVEGRSAISEVGHILHEEDEGNLVFAVIAFEVLAVSAVPHLFVEGNQSGGTTCEIEPAPKMPVGLVGRTKKNSDDLTLAPLLGHREVRGQAMGCWHRNLKTNRVGSSRSPSSGISRSFLT